MNDDLYEIAKQNLKYKQRTRIFAAIGVTLFILWFSFWLTVDPSINWAWFIFGPAILLFFFLSYKNGKKVVGKRDPVLQEMNRLKQNEGEVLDLNERDSLELIEREKKYREDDFV